MPSNMIAMEDCTVAKGVFLHTESLDSELMLRSLQILLKSFPNIRFTSVKIDEKYLGYRVHFSNPDEETVLAKKHLSVSGRNIPICPLTTILTIQNINSERDSKLKNNILEVIKNRFGKLIPRFPGCQNKNTKNLRVCIDIPEVKELDGFSEMCMLLREEKQNLKLSFYCRICKKDGPIQHGCLYGIQRKASSTEERVNKNDSNSLPSTSVSHFNISLDSTETFAEKIGREEVMKTGILLDNKQKVKETKSNKSTLNTKTSKLSSLDWPFIKVKEEAVETEKIIEVKEEKSQNAENHNIKREPKEEPFNMLDNNDESKSDSLMDDDIQVIEYQSNLNSSAQHSFHFMLKDKAEATNSNEILSSPTQESNAQLSFSALGFSNTNHSTAKPSSVEITSVLSERLQDCINSACNEFKILNRQTLDAFLIHVKKKSNPLRVARNYTQNAAELKEQLKHILKLYYNTPQMGTKDDTQFIKWLGGLVERFDGTVPKKRKRAGQNHDDEPRKK